MSPEVQAKLAILKQKAIDGTLTIDDQREAVRIMRADRKAAPPPTTSSTRRARAKAEIKSADEMLDELGKI